MLFSSHISKNSIEIVFKNCRKEIVIILIILLKSHIMKEKHQVNFELLTEFRKANKLFDFKKYQA